MPERQRPKAARVAEKGDPGTSAETARRFSPPRGNVPEREVADERISRTGYTTDGTRGADRDRRGEPTTEQAGCDPGLGGNLSGRIVRRARLIRAASRRPSALKLRPSQRPRRPKGPAHPTTDRRGSGAEGSPGPGREAFGYPAEPLVVQLSRESMEKIPPAHALSGSARPHGLRPVEPAKGGPDRGRCDARSEWSSYQPRFRGQRSGGSADS